MSITLNVAQILLVLGVIGIIVAALRYETVCRRLIRLLGAFTKAVGALVKLLNEWNK